MELPLSRNSLERGMKPRSSRGRRKGWSGPFEVCSGPLAREAAGTMPGRIRQASAQRRRRCDVGLGELGTGMAFGAYSYGTDALRCTVSQTKECGQRMQM